MAGNQKRPALNKDFMDPFNAGQMVGMLVMLTFIEKNKGIPQKALEDIKNVAARNIEQYLDKPSEDIFLMVDNIVRSIEII